MPLAVTEFPRADHPASASRPMGAVKVALMRERLPSVRQLASGCRLCPRECGVNRLAGQLGTCRAPYGPTVSSVNLHFGEEPPISGARGSGTVFLTGCNLRCLFCQNFPISQLRHGKAMTPAELAARMLDLQDRGAHNINLVTPTPQAAAVFEALLIAFERGLEIPIVYNSGGYESVEMLRLWEGIVDVYLPDAKYSGDEAAALVSLAPCYAQHNRAVLKEMFRQVGNLTTDEDGMAVRGLIVRHLVLPEGLAGTEEVLRFVAKELSPTTAVSLMSQYFPAWKAHDHPALGRKLTRKEYHEAVGLLAQFGLENGWIQPC